MVDRAPMVELGCRILERAGVPSEHAQIVMDHLADASAMGLHSHGLMRIPQYLQEVATGAIDPAAIPDVRRVSPSRLAVDARHGFGQVIGMALVDGVIPIARELGMAIATGRRLGHTGRVGAYPEALARAGLIGIAACSGPPSGHWVAPFGGREGHISTNPLAFAWPARGAEPVVADFSTAATAEGVVRSLRNRGLPTPDGFLRDADGLPTMDPGALYATPRGAIQAFGGPLGYRGTALALLVEVLTTLLSDESIDDPTSVGTDMTLIAIQPSDGFGELAARLSEHIRSTLPIDPMRPVLMPGDRERAAASAATGLLVDAPTWAALAAAAADASLTLPEAHPA
ncbi:MAG: Ldh family oxidoreductase [Chloroflexi bacterium]|nr:Ldh family oxidoreductase [Chloroflexota bacterium]